MSPPAWRDREARRAEDDRLPRTPPARAARTLTLGPEGWRWRAAIEHAAAPSWRRAVPAVASLRRVWRHHDGWDGPQRHGREADNMPPAAPCLRSPSASAAHDARQHTTPWVGDNVPRPETCDDALPPLIPHGETPRSQAARQPRGLTPGTPIVATGFLAAELLVERPAHSGVDVRGPIRRDEHRQARQGAGVAAQPCRIAGAPQHATCPAGKTRISWTPAVDTRGHAGITVTFSTKDGRPCPTFALWVRAQTRAPRRTVTIRSQPP